MRKESEEMVRLLTLNVLEDRRPETEEILPTSDFGLPTHF